MSRIHSLFPHTKISGYAVPIRWFCASILLVFSPGLFAASFTQARPITTFSVAQLFSQGDYGLDVETKMSATVFKIAHRSRIWGASVSVPYLSITGPATAIYEDIDTGELFLVDIDDEQRSGIGDTVFSLDRVVWKNRRTGQKLSLGAAIKLPTGDKDQRLSSGKADGSFFAKGRIRKHRNILSGQLGYQVMGDTEFTDYNNRFFFTASLFHFVNRRWGVGGSLRFKQASLDDRQDQRSASVFMTRKFRKTWSLALRFNRGLTDAVADSSAALVLSYQKR